MDVNHQNYEGSWLLITRTVSSSQNTFYETEVMVPHGGWTERVLERRFKPWEAARNHLL